MMAQELEQELFELEQYIKDLWQFLPIPLVYFNPQGIIMDVSASLEKVFDLKKEEIIGQYLPAFFEDQTFFRQIVQETETKSLVENIQAQLHPKPEKTIWADLSAQIRRDETGKSIGYFLAINDLTKLMMMQEQLKERFKDLKEFSDLAVGRELKMMELEKEVNQLLKELGRTPRYK